MSTIGASMTRFVTLPIAAAGVASVALSVDFDKSMTKIAALVGASDAQMKQYRATVLDLAKQTGRGPKELAEALYFVASSGFEGASALRVLTASAKASAAGLGDTATIADAVTSAVNAYGEANLSASKATDILLAAVREGKNEPEELAGSIGRVIPVAQAMGVSFGEVAGTMAALSLNGTDANEAVTQIVAGMSQSIKPTKQGAEQLAKLNMTYADLRKSIKDKGLIDTFNDLKDAFGGNVEAVGKVFGNIRALRGVLTLTGPAAEKYKDIIKAVGEAQGDTNKAFGIAAQSPAQKFAVALAKLKVAAIEMGTALTPIALQIASAVAKMAEAFNSLGSGGQKAVLVLAGIAAMAGPLLRTAGAIGQIAGGVKAAGGIAPAIASTINPLTAVVALLGGAAAAAHVVSEMAGTDETRVGAMANQGVNPRDIQSWQAYRDRMHDAAAAARMVGTAMDTTVRQMANGNLTMLEGQGQLRDYISRLREMRRAATDSGNKQLAQHITALIGKFKGLAGTFKSTGVDKMFRGAGKSAQELGRDLDAAQQKAANLRNQIKVRQKLGINASDAKRQLAETEALIKRLKKQQIKLTIQAETKDVKVAEAYINKFKGGHGRGGGFGATFKFKADTSAFDSSARKTKSTLKTIGGTRVKPTIGITDNATSPLQNIKSLIDSLQSKTITITAITSKVNPQAKGGDYLVTKPTLFLAGEAGVPERATFTPMPNGRSQTSSGTGGAPLFEGCTFIGAPPESWIGIARDSAAEMVAAGFVEMGTDGEMGAYA